ncbi:M20 family metallo-hydrolase [Halovivax gelatinilyticus]|uniref:M20 family metallo-hydrolase n=1 Tax=Halovivax gelatinilyticus TaxID=2961597 RepID=UPI0020CA3704|nr:M20 family metallo-hydrolase [Halovivax gelatinilyticus]
MIVDEDRLRRDIDANAAFGEIDTDVGRGRTVLTGTEANRKARDRFVGRLDDAGLDVSVDAVGNVFGRWVPESADPDAAPIVAGSHLDSVPEGGIFDGPLGVYAALEAVRSLQERGVEPARPVGVVSFTEEEGSRFGGGMLGSAVATGQLDPEGALSLEDDDGVSLESALDSIGYRGEDVVDASEWAGFLELHVEQDTRLEHAGVAAGIVTTVTGIAQATVTFEGEANHAGATAMDDRRDALAAASEFISVVERVGQSEADAGENTAVATVGKLSVGPNATNVVPGHVELGVDVRDVERESMERIFDALANALGEIESSRGVETSFDRTLDVDPAPMSDVCQDALRAGADAAVVQVLSMHSGAAHDAMRVSRITDAGMLFAPSRDGISHNPREWTDWEDCGRTASVLTNAIEELV